MTRVCTICINEARQAIDTALIAGTPYRSIARTHKVSEDAVLRHKTEGHIAEKIARKSNLQQMIDADDLLGQVRTLQEQAFGVLKDAQGKIGDDGTTVLTPRDHHLMLKAMREARDGVRLLGEVLGKLRPRDGGDTIVPTTVIVQISDNGRGIAPPRQIGVAPEADAQRITKGGNGNGKRARR